MEGFDEDSNSKMQIDELLSIQESITERFYQASTYEIKMTDEEEMKRPSGFSLKKPETMQTPRPQDELEEEIKEDEM